MKFDGFCQDYNHRRPHEGLQQKTPASRYQRSERSFPEAIPEPSYPDYFELRKVGHNGTLHWHNRLIYVSYVFQRETVGLCEIDDGIYEVYFGPVSLGTFDEKEAVDQKKSYISLRV